MKDDAQVKEVNIAGCNEVINRIINARFCKNECPVPKKDWSCGCRPAIYIKECPKLKSFNRRKGR